ncbi:hypothetical protein LQ327_20235 [Actinomycetospora endophytica]|uniref:MarR family transcriptional regulator n=1 Tax=Actinomycetospora endophytica TaxID=2291215 RepID=A0ABS8PCI2_9PSEU|nr:hypothetical protein [Actinomycetospora endophytica]MCD2195703.1 hypothetical protein [Actinomycetospora endophytica]
MTVTTLAKPDYDVLNVLALKKMAGAPAIAAVVDLSAEDVSARLDALAAGGFAVVAGGAALPTDSAEPALAATASEIYAPVRTDADLLGLVEQFEKTNAQLLTTMSAWQQVDVGGRKVANDHTDAEYDEKIISRLERLVGRLDGLIDALARHDPRFATYATRFGAALEGIDGGDHDLVSSPTGDSIHTVWFEFHEDLLRTLGRERAE